MQLEEKKRMGTLMKKTRQKYWVGVLIIVCTLFILISGTTRIDAKKTEKTEFTLTMDEETYLETIRNQPITFGVSESTEYTKGSQGKWIGTATPMLKFLQEELGLEIRVVQGDYGSLYQLLKDSKLDLMNNISIDEDTTQQIYLASPISTASLVMVVNHDNAGFNLENVSGAHIGMGKDSPAYYYGLPYIQDKRTITSYAGTTQLFAALKKKEIEVAIVPDTALDTVYFEDTFQVADSFSQVKINNTVGTCNSDYSNLIRILKRFLDTSIEGDTLKNQVDGELEQTQLELFRIQELATIETVKKQYSTIKYYGGNGRSFPLSYLVEEKKQGIIPDLFSHFAQITGIELNEEKDITEEDGMDGLRDNQIQFVAGTVATQEIVDEYGFSEELIKDSYVAVRGLQKKNISKSQLGNYDWGILGVDEPAFSHSTLDGHLLTFFSEEELFHSLSQQQVEGIITKQEVLDYYNLVLGSKQYANVLALSLPCSERIAYNKENQELNQLMNHFIHFYKTVHPNYIEEWTTQQLDYTGQLRQQYLKEVKLKHGIVIFAVCFIVLLASMAAGILFYSQAFIRMSTKLKMLTRSNENLDVIEVDMKAMTIQSSAGFTQYGGRLPSGKSQEMSLKQLSQLTGYNYEEHYAKIYGQKQELFELEYCLFIDGQQHNRKEIGNKKGKYIVSTVFDCGQEEEKGPILSQKLDYDPLTGLISERAYVEKICEIVEDHPEKMGVFALLDLDQFKNINDRFGHMAGDEILKAFAESINRLKKNADTIIFRVGADEFGAFRGNIENEQQLLELLDELRGLSAATQIEGRYMERSYSCGVSIYTKHTVEIQKLIDYAKEALYECKQGNEKIIVWNDDMDMGKIKPVI